MVRDGKEACEYDDFADIWGADPSLFECRTWSYESGMKGRGFGLVARDEVPDLDGQAICSLLLAGFATWSRYRRYRVSALFLRGGLFVCCLFVCSG